MTLYRAEIWAVDRRGLPHGIESDVNVDDLESPAWSAAVMGSASLPGSNEPGPVYVRIGNRSAAADVVTVEHLHTHPSVTLLGVSPFE